MPTFESCMEEEAARAHQQVTNVADQKRRVVTMLKTASDATEATIKK